MNDSKRCTLSFLASHSSSWTQDIMMASCSSMKLTKNEELVFPASDDDDQGRKPVGGHFMPLKGRECCTWKEWKMRMLLLFFLIILFLQTTRVNWNRKQKPSKGCDWIIIINNIKDGKTNRNERQSRISYSVRVITTVLSGHEFRRQEWKNINHRIQRREKQNLNFWFCSFFFECVRATGCNMNLKLVVLL